MRSTPRALGAVLVLALLAVPALPGTPTLAAAPAAVPTGADEPAAVPVSHPAAAPAQTATGGYHYSSAYTQLLGQGEHSRGLRATFSVHRPKQVEGLLGQHSVAQIAVGDSSNRAFVEAGWRQFLDGPRLFVYWRPADGSTTCYDLGCGFHDRGKGKPPGTSLKPGTTVTIGFKFAQRKWWLIVNGKKSGYYPAKLWDGKFTRSDYSLIYGEVYVDPSQQLCADMGNGKRAKRKKAARVRRVRFYDGPKVELTINEAQNDADHYSIKLTGDRSFRYGGPGTC